MHPIEKWCTKLRHSAALRRAEWLWNAVRPAYNAALAKIGSHGLSRVINGTDEMLVLPELRGFAETYEPEVWSRIMSDVRSGDTIIDIGAHAGLYAIAFAKRVGPQGRVVAFEPDPENFELLRRQISLNGLDDCVECCCAALGKSDGMTSFIAGRAVQSRMTAAGEEGVPVKVCRLDSVCDGMKVDFIKIDVEGFEEKVIEGAATLLSDPQRKPRAIFIEVHPYNWHLCGTTSEALITRLTTNGYDVLDLSNRVVSTIDFYGEIVARLSKRKQGTTD